MHRRRETVTNASAQESAGLAGSSPFPFASHAGGGGQFAQIASDVQSTCSGFGATLAPAAFKSEAAAQRT